VASGVNVAGVCLCSVGRSLLSEGFQGLLQMIDTVEARKVQSRTKAWCRDVHGRWCDEWLSSLSHASLRCLRLPLPSLSPHIGR